MLAVDNPFIVGIEMCALRPAHSSLLRSNGVLRGAAASLCDDGLMESKMLRLRSSSPIARSQRIRRRRRWGLAQAERLREDYPYSVPLGAQPPWIRS